MDAIARIAEDRVRRAIDEGQLDDLPGSGKPLRFEDETWIPRDLRLAYRMLKNAGFLPPELELRKEIMSLRRLIDTIDDDAERLKRLRELDFKIAKLGMMRGRSVALGDYEWRLMDKTAEP
ncbi:MAG: DUF1992 domain-containing protein [Thermodesulfovibrionales bacterium]